MPRPLRYAAVAAALLVFTNGPVFFAARNLTADSGGWEGDLIRPTIIAAALLALATAALDLARKQPVVDLIRGGRPAVATAALDLTRKSPAGRPAAVGGVGGSAELAPSGGTAAAYPARPSPAGLARPHDAAAAAIAAYTLAAIASTAWSVAPGLTLWRSLVYAGLVLLAWVMADMGPDVRVPLGLMAAAAVGASLLALAAAPNQAFDIRGYWQGVYTNRNSLAPLAALGLLVGIRLLLTGPGGSELTEQPEAARPAEPPEGPKQPEETEPDAHPEETEPVDRDWRRWRAPAAGTALGAASLGALIGAGSRTAWLSLIGALAVSALGWSYPRLRRRHGPRTAAGAVLGAAAVGLASLAAVTAALWQESTFAQRRTIWGLVWDRIADRPIVGHGFFAFWDVPELIAEHELLQDGSAHNSALEVLLGTGLIGLALFAVIAVAAALNAGRDLVRNPGADTWLWAAVVAFAMFGNAGESFVLWFSYNWVIVMAAALRCPGPRRPPLRLSRPDRPPDAKTGAKAQAPA